MSKGADVGDLLIQIRVINRLLAAQLRNSIGQKELLGILVSTGAIYEEFADVLDTSAATVKVVARRFRNARKNCMAAGGNG